MVKSLFNVGAVLPAAGVGIRFGEKKQFKYLANKPLFLYALNIFLKCKEIAEIVIVTNKEDVEYIYKETKSLKTKKPIKVIAGGSRRQDSVMNGCLELSNSIEFVTIHDIVRPFVTNDLILSTILGCNDNDGCIAALLSKDTVKEVTPSEAVTALKRASQDPETEEAEVETEEEVTETLIAEQKEEKNEEEFDWF